MSRGKTKQEHRTQEHSCPSIETIDTWQRLLHLGVLFPVLLAGIMFLAFANSSEKWRALLTWGGIGCVLFYLIGLIVSVAVAWKFQNPGE